MEDFRALYDSRVPGGLTWLCSGLRKPVLKSKQARRDGRTTCNKLKHADGQTEGYLERIK